MMARRHGSRYVIFTLRWATTQVRTVYFDNVLRPETHNKSYHGIASNYLPSDVIELSYKVIPCHTRVRPWAVVRVDLHPLGWVLVMYSRSMASSQIRLCA
jgi:hypothetical protein